MDRLAGQTALVTGAASGIGLATTKALIAEGACVALCDRSEQNLVTAAETLGERSAPFVVDLSDSDQLDDLVPRVINRFGKLDVVHANAGIYVGGDVSSGDPNAWDTMLNLNVNSVFRLIRSALPHLKERRTGDIIITSSISGHMLVPHEPVYNASKHAVRAFVHALREQVVAHGIRVSEVAPGLTVTPLLNSWPAEALAPLLDKNGGLSPDDVAEAVVFMLTRPRSVVIRDLVILAQSAQLVPFE